MKFFFVILLISQFTFASTFNNQFSKRYVRGIECDGGEAVASKLEGQWMEFSCLSGEWLIQVKKFLPVTVKLVPIRSAPYSDKILFNLVPTIPTEPTVRAYLRQNPLRVTVNGEIE